MRPDCHQTAQNSWVAGPFVETKAMLVCLGDLGGDLPRCFSDS